MHRHLAWAVGFLLLGCAAASASPPAVPVAASDLAKIKAVLIEGNVTLEDSGGGYPLALGAIFAQGARITVGAGQSQAGLAFSNGNFLVASANTSFSVTRYQQAPCSVSAAGSFLHLAVGDPSKSTLALTLTSGTLLAEIQYLNLDAGSSVRINTPMAWLVVNGPQTLFRLSASSPADPQGIPSEIVDLVEGGLSCTWAGRHYLALDTLLKGREYVISGLTVPPAIRPEVVSRALTPAEITAIKSDLQQARTAALAQ